MFGKFCQNRHGKTRKNRELGVLTSGIKRDGHQKKPGNLEIRELEVPGIRRDDCIKIHLKLSMREKKIKTTFKNTIFMGFESTPVY